MKQYFLVTDATAEEVKAKAGLQGKNTALGTLVEQSTPFNLDKALDDLDRAMHPNKLRCICGPYAILHLPNCPTGLVMT